MVAATRRSVAVDAQTYSASRQLELPLTTAPCGVRRHTPIHTDASGTVPGVVSMDASSFSNHLPHRARALPTMCPVGCGFSSVRQAARAAQRSRLPAGSLQNNRGKWMKPWAYRAGEVQQSHRTKLVRRVPAPRPNRRVHPRCAQIQHGLSDSIRHRSFA